MVKPLLTIITLLYCASSSAKTGSPPASTITFIAQIEHVELNKTALSHDMKLILAVSFFISRPVILVKQIQFPLDQNQWALLTKPMPTN